MTEVCQVLKMFEKSENYNILADPIKNKSLIEKIIKHSIRIYTSGKKYPKLSLIPLADWPVTTKSGKNFIQVIQSGVHKFPIESHPDSSSFIDISNNDIQDIKTKYSEVESYIDSCGKFIHYFPQEALHSRDDKYKQLVYYKSLMPAPEDIANLFSVKVGAELQLKTIFQTF